MPDPSSRHMVVAASLLLLMLFMSGSGADYVRRTIDKDNNCAPTGTATDAAGNIYIACAVQTIGLQIRKVSVPSYASDAVLMTYDFGSVGGITCDKTNNILYVSAGSSVHKASLAVGAAAPSVFASGFNGARGLTIDAEGNVYVADVGNGKVMKVTSTGTKTIFWAAGGLIGIFIDSTYIWACSNQIVYRRMLASPNTLLQAPQYTMASGSNGICADAANNVYVSDSSYKRINILAPNLQTKLGEVHSFGTDVGGVSLDASGNIIVSDYGSKSTHLYTPRLPLFQPPFAPPVSTIFSYTGAKQTYTVPANTFFLQIDACGGEGGQGGAGYVGNAPGGYIQSRIPVTPGSTLHIYVGGSGNTGSTTGGYNGGGSSTYSNSNGGGGTDIRTGDGGTTGSDNTDTRIVVAGGAGGNANFDLTTTLSTDLGGGNKGGGLVGGAGRSGTATPACASAGGVCTVSAGYISGWGGQGGSQTAGGLPTTDCTDFGTGAGCNPGLFWAGASTTSGRGGGGGLWGGGAGSGNTAAGGGSSYTIATGTIVQNVQGDSRCVGNGFLAVSPWQPVPTTAPL